MINHSCENQTLANFTRSNIWEDSNLNKIQNKTHAILSTFMQPYAKVR